MIIAAGVIALVYIRNDVLHGEVAPDELPVCDREPTFHCAADAPPLAPLEQTPEAVGR